ncbi:MAG: DUF3450 family protein, partial [Phycisphaeraceae bacterium JB051]
NQHQQRFDRLTTQVQQAKQNVLEAQLENEQLISKLTELKQQRSDDLQWLTAVSASALEASKQINLQRTLTPQSLALLQDSVEQLAKQAKTKPEDVNQSFDAIMHLIQWLQTQRQQARRVELVNRTITLPDKRVIHAYVLQVGTVAEFFTSEDYSLAGYRSANGWQTDLTQTQQQQLAQAIAMLRGKLPPALIALPFDVQKAGQ